MRDRRKWLVAGAGLAIVCALTGMAIANYRDARAIYQALDTAKEKDPEPDDVKIRPELASGVAYLLKQQSADGAWRSDLYAAFKDGTALTPLVVQALQEAGDSKSTAAIRKGCEFLAKLIKPDGTTEGGEAALDYPVYTAALAVTTLSHALRREPQFRKPRDAWLKYLLDRQLTEKLGWQPADKQYGGWGYCRFIPKKPEPGAIAPPLIESNLSATVFALDALKAAGVKDRSYSKKGLVFVRRCQNYVPPQACIYIEHKDGGFHLIYDDPVRNKAGAVPEKEDDPPSRFYSYGSATADGFRALTLFPDSVDDFRRHEARTWLEAFFKPDAHPGKYIKAHESNREAVYYYYAASAAKSLRLAKVKEAGGKPWAETLAAELIRRQKPDGSWANPVELVRENEPLVATANAVIALANCR